MKKILFLSIFFFVILFLYFLYVYIIGPKISYYKGRNFVKTCESLTNNEFNYDNVSQLNGFANSVNGLEKVNVNHINNYINRRKESKYSIFGFTVFRENFFKGPNIKYSWKCVIYIDGDNLITDSHADFDLTD